jgi:hypothetical protein
MNILLIDNSNSQIEGEPDQEISVTDSNISPGQNIGTPKVLICKFCDTVATSRCSVCQSNLCLDHIKKFDESLSAYGSSWVDVCDKCLAKSQRDKGVVICIIVIAIVSVSSIIAFITQ